MYDVRCRYEGSHNASLSERVTHLDKRSSSTQFQIGSFRSCVKDPKAGSFDGNPPMSSASFRRLTQGLRNSTSWSEINTGDLTLGRIGNNPRRQVCAGIGERKLFEVVKVVKAVYRSEGFINSVLSPCTDLEFAYTSINSRGTESRKAYKVPIDYNSTVWTNI